MSSQSEYCGTAGQGNFASGGGDSSWSTLSNAQGSPSGSFATSNVPHTSPQTSESIDLYNFGFSIPTGATINGIAGSITAKSQVNTVPTFNQTWVEAGSTAGNFTASGLAGTALSTTATAYNTGSSTDLCGISSQLTYTNCNGNTENAGLTFGFQFKNTGAVTQTISVEGIQATVYYTATSPPGAPTGLTVTTDATNPTTALDLSWAAGTGSPTSYSIERSTTLGGTFSVLATGVTGTTYTDSSLTPGSEYAYKVAGVNGGGTGPYCSAVAYATEAAAPTGLSPSATSTSVTVSFTQSSFGSNIGITSNGCRYETPPGSGNWVNGGTVSDPFTISSLTPGTQYGVEVDTTIQSTNGDFAGTILGPWSSETTIVTPINAIPARCNVIMARKIDGFYFINF